MPVFLNYISSPSDIVIIGKIPTASAVNIYSSPCGNGCTHDCFESRTKFFVKICSIAKIFAGKIQIMVYIAVFQADTLSETCIILFERRGHMSISFQPGSKVDSLQSYIRNSDMSRNAAANTGKTTSSSAADFDTVTIQKNSAPDDKSFASVLAKKVSESVQTGVNENKVAEIRQRVETGEYRIDPARIAEHMLGYI